MDEIAPRDVFLASVERCAAQEGFLDSFYDRFMKSSDEVRDKFRYTDFARQKQMLLKSLRLSAGATAGEQTSLHELHERAKTHDRWHHNIEPKLYLLWLETLVESAAEYDSEWSPCVEQAWRSTLSHVIHHMSTRY